MPENLRIRSITVGVPFDKLDPYSWNNIKNLLEFSDDFLNLQNVEIQTKRLLLEPFKFSLYNDDFSCLFSMLDSIGRRIEDCKIRWVCLPIFVNSKFLPESFFDIAPELIRKYPFLFLHFSLLPKYDIQMHHLLEISKVILAVSNFSSSGYDNFKIGVGSNILPNGPFFPFSYHAGTQGFSFALETMSLAINETRKLLTTNCQLNDFKTYLTEFLVKIFKLIDNFGIHIQKHSKVPFNYKGLDGSFAPYPESGHSIADFIELLGPSIFGRLGTVSTTAFLTHTIKSALIQSGVKNVGFNGCMFSPLEDIGLAKRLNDQNLSVENFMLYSTVCGCGVDMIPIDGYSLSEDIALLIQDVFTLSCIHQKPLGVRILPIPNKRVNEQTSFNHDFLVNTRIISIKGRGYLLNEKFAPLFTSLQ